MPQSLLVNLSYRGGDFKKNLSLNLGLFDQEGVIVNSTNKRLFLNTRIKRKVFNDKIDVFSITNLSYKKGNASSVGNGHVPWGKYVNTSNSNGEWEVIVPTQVSSIAKKHNILLA